MRARDVVVTAQRRAHPDRHRFLADVEMGQARHLRALVELVHLLLECANLRHLAIHMEVLLELHPRFDHLSRHRKVSPCVLRSLTRGCSSRGPVSSRSLWHAERMRRPVRVKQFRGGRVVSTAPIENIFRHRKTRRGAPVPGSAR